MSGTPRRPRAAKATKRLRPEYTVRPVGVVRSPVGKIADDCWGGIVSTIELDASQFGPESTLGLNDYSHVEIVFLLDQIKPEQVDKGASHPRGRKDWPVTGIFARRSKTRPNRVGVTVCKILSVDGLKVRVHELDAVNGTPVLDIKPYLKGFGPREEVREPAWAIELMSRYFRKV